MKYICDLERRDSSDALATYGDYFIIEPRGMTDAEFSARIEQLKNDLAPKSFLQKIYWKIFIRKPVEQTTAFKHGVGELALKKNLWPNYRAMIIVCPFCKVPFTSTKDHDIKFEPGITVDKELECPYGKQKLKIENEKLYELTIT